MARRRFFVDSFETGFAVLAGEGAQHLSRVLRVQPGQQFELSDSSSVYLGEVTDVSSRQIRFRLLEPIEAREPAARVTLLASLIKFDRFEWMLEKATELGVEAILPVAAARSEAGLLEAARKRVERWRRIVRESSQQSRRVRTPEIMPPVPLDRLTVRGHTWHFLLDEEPGGTPFAKALAAADTSGPIALLIGPEGGWTEAERRRLQPDWTRVSLGVQILRAETAAIASLAIVMSLLG